MKGNKKQLDVFAKMMLVITIMTLIPAISIGYIGLDFFRKDTVNQKYNALQALVLEKSRTLEYTASELKKHAFSMSTNRDIRQMLTMRDDGLTDANKAEYDKVHGEVNSYLALQYKNSEGFFENIFVADGTGLNVADAIGGKAYGNKESDREFFIGAMKGKQIFTEIDYSPVTGRACTIIGTPIYRTDDLTQKGKIIGMIALPVDFINFTDNLVAEKDDDGMTKYAIYDKHGTAIAATSSDYVGFNLANGSEYDVQLFEYMTEVKSGTDLSLSTSSSNIYTAFAKATEKDWYFAAIAEADSFLQPVENFRNLMFTALFVIIIAALILSSFFSRSIAIEAEESMKVLYESNPQASLIFSQDFEIIDCTPSALAFYGCQKVEELAQRYKGFWALAPESGLGIEEFVLEKQDKLIKFGNSTFECIHNVNGVNIPLNIVSKRIKFKGQTAYASFHYDLSTLKATQSILLEREVLLEAVNQIGEILLTVSNSELEGVINAALDVCGKAMKANRIRLWKNEINSEGELWSTQINEWQSNKKYALEGHQTKIKFIEKFPTLCYRIEKGETINIKVKEMSPIESYYFKTQGVLSILVSPIMISGAFWGYIIVSDCENERVFRPTEENMLDTTGTFLASSLFRNGVMEDLIVAKDDALSSARSKTEFLSRMSHEIRTPMNAIIGMTRIALKTNEYAKIQNSLAKIDIASNHLLGVINDILDMAKIEANKLELSKTNFSLSKLVSNVYSVNAIRAEENNQKFTINYDKTIPDCLYGDNVRLAQIITNLISNAIKFTSKFGSVEVYAKHLRTDEKGDIIVEFSVSDTGIGISLEQQKNLFKVFEQADGSISRKFGGTGLGLAISKSFVELMGGNIWIESEEGKGSTFRFIIPLQVGDEQLIEHENAVMFNAQKNNVQANLVGATSLETSQIEATSQTNFANNSRRILIAEDVEINVEIILSILEDLNLDIDVAENGQIAVDKFKECKGDYAIVFMDIQMPLMDGFEATRIIRALDMPRAKTVPIVAMTANAFKEDVEKCIESGMNSHLSKPIDIDKLFEKIKEYISW